jgi:hypothetical protein
VREENSQMERHMKYCCKTTLYVKYHSEYTRCTAFRHVVLHGHTIGREMKDYLPGLEPTSHMSNQPVLSTNVKAFQSQPTWKKKETNSHCRHDFWSHTAHLQQLPYTFFLLGASRNWRCTARPATLVGVLCASVLASAVTVTALLRSTGTSRKWETDKIQTRTQWNIFGRSKTAPPPPVVTVIAQQYSSTTFVSLRFHKRKAIFGTFQECYYSRTPLIRTLVNRIANYPDWLGPSGKFVQDSSKLTCLEVTGYPIKYSTLLWFLELQIMNGRKI